jgi:hypothetical protein
VAQQRCCSGRTKLVGVVAEFFAAAEQHRKMAEIFLTSLLAHIQQQNIRSLSAPDFRYDVAHPCCISKKF